MPTVWILNIALAFILCVFFAGIVIPQILLIAFRRRLFDEPDERKIHTSVVPRLGGIAFKPVVFFTVALLLALNVTFGYTEVVQAIGQEGLSLAYAFCAIMMLYLVGMADDLIGVRYRAKFFIQLLCGLMLVGGGVMLSQFNGLFLLHQLPLWAALPLTIFVTIFIINAINLIDGIDGLCSGLCSIAFLYYGVTFICYGYYLQAMLAFATLGVLVPFYYYNVFGNAEKGRKIFMGDTGSLTIGIMLCYHSLEISQLPTARLGFNPFVLAFAPLIVPCFDVVRVYFHRVRNGRNPFLPDKNHIHHKLLALGMKQRAAMGTIITISTLITLVNILLSTFIGVTLLLLIDMVAWTATNIFITKKIHRINQQI